MGVTHRLLNFEALALTVFLVMMKNKFYIYGFLNTSSSLLAKQVRILRVTEAVKISDAPATHSKLGDVNKKPHFNYGV